MEERTFLDLRIQRGREGTWHLKQDVGPCDDTSEHWIVLETEHLETLARMAGFVPAAEVHRGYERVQERLALLAAMVRAHTGESDPLRAAAEALTGTLGGDCIRPAPRESCPSGDLSSLPIIRPIEKPAPDGFRESLSLDLEQ